MRIEKYKVEKQWGFWNETESDALVCVCVSQSTYFWTDSWHWLCTFNTHFMASYSYHK